MELEDRLTLATPEGVDLDLVVAGLGSRFLAILVDGILQMIALAALLAGAAFLGDTGAVLVVVGVFLLFIGYPIAWEVLADGRTPGKMVAGLRVVTEDGVATGFVPSAVRNVLRLIDLLPAFYTVGVVAILGSGRNQRLGDMAAGTLVVRSAPAAKGSMADLVAAAGAAPPAPALPPGADSWDVSAVGADEVGAVRSFLARRDSLAPEARAEIALTLASRLAPKVVGVPTEHGPEAFLELLAAAKGARS